MTDQDQAPDPAANDVADEHPDAHVGEEVEDPYGIDPASFEEEPPDDPDAVDTELEA